MPNRAGAVLDVIVEQPVHKWQRCESNKKKICNNVGLRDQLNGWKYRRARAGWMASWWYFIIAAFFKSESTFWCMFKDTLEIL